MHSSGFSPLSPTHSLLPYRLPYYLFAAQANFPSSLWNSTEHVWASLFFFFSSRLSLFRNDAPIVQWPRMGYVFLANIYIYLSISKLATTQCCFFLTVILNHRFCHSIRADHLLLSGQYGEGGGTKWLSQVRAVFLGSFTP